MPDTWTLHPQLEADTAPVGDLALSRLLAINHADYPWLVLVPRSPNIVEIADLADADLNLLTAEIAQVSRVLKTLTACDKINLAAIGNVVPQLHVHIVARWKTDPLWPKPVWGMGAVVMGNAESFARFVERLREETRIQAKSSVKQI
jgi:diadenosine tetraphosphate (Ap4A) HIT family hydrolase